jgi:AcrR family transcriptional regulator
MPSATASRPGGRSARVRADVLESTGQILATVGYEALRVEDVAARAGVHKTTIYRRWPTKAELVMAAVEARSEARVPLPDTGSLEGDLRRFSRSIVDNLRAGGGVAWARTLVIAADGSDELRAAASAFWARRFSIAGEMVRRAVDRAEVPAGTDADALIETLIGPLYVRALLTDGALDRRLADRVARVAAAAAADGSFVSRR